MGCLKLLNNSKLFAIAGGTKYQPLAVAYKREWLLDESINDAHGNMLSMPHLSLMQWDFADRLKSASNGTFTSYYNYDSGGERSRKVVVKGNIVEMRFYIGAYEVFRKYVNGSLDTERQTLHVDDDNKKVALVDTLTIENEIGRAHV